MQTITTKNGNTYYVIWSTPYKQTIIDINKYSQGVYNKRDERVIDCSPSQLRVVLDNYGF